MHRVGTDISRLFCYGLNLSFAAAYAPPQPLTTYAHRIYPMKATPRILFVEDHEDTRRILTVLLRGQGYDLKTAPSFDEGPRMAQGEDFDLFLLDYQLAGGTGRELCRRIREFDPHTPILFFSGSHPKVQEEALSCGAQGFVLKPDVDALREEIRKNLNPAA